MVNTVCNFKNLSESEKSTRIDIGSASTPNEFNDAINSHFVCIDTFYKNQICASFQQKVLFLHSFRTSAFAEKKVDIVKELNNNVPPNCPLPELI